MPIESTCAHLTQAPLPASAPKTRITTGKGSAGEKSWNLRRPITLIGSRRTSHILLRHPEVSKAHCLVVNTGRHVVARDLNSRTGTYVNGQVIRLVGLRHGDVMRIGPVQIEFAIQADGDTSEPDPVKAPFTVGLKRKDGNDQWALDDAVCLIGRKTGCDVFLDHQDISLAHAVVCSIDGQPVVFDLGSRTGTWLNGQQIHFGYLRPGDTLRVGPFELGVVLNGVSEPCGGEGGSVVDEVPTGPDVPRVIRAGPVPAETCGEPTDLCEPVDDEVVPADHDGVAGKPDAAWQDIVISTPDDGGAPSDPGDSGPSEGRIFNVGSLLNNLEQNLATLQQNMAQSAHQMAQWQKDLQARASRLDHREQELNKRERILEAHQKELQAAQAELEQRRTEVLEEIEQQRHQLAEMQAHVTAQSEQLADRVKALEHREAELKTQQDRVDQARADVETQEKALHQERHALKAAGEEMERREQALAAARSQLERDQAEWEHRKSAAEDHLRQQSDALEAVSADIERQRQDLEARVAQHQTEVRAVIEAKQELEETARKLDTRSAELDRREQQLAKRLAGVQQQAARVEKEFATLRKQAALIQQLQSALAQANAIFAAPLSPGQDAVCEPDGAPPARPAVELNVGAEESELAGAEACPSAPLTTETRGGASPPDPDPPRVPPPSTEADPHKGPARSDTGAAVKPTRPDGIDGPPSRQTGAGDPAPQARPHGTVSVSPPGHVPARSDSPKTDPPVLQLDPETREQLRMMRRLGAKGTDEELLAQLTAKHKSNRPEDESEPTKKKRWWSR